MKKTVCVLLAVMLCASAFGMLCVSGAETASSAATIDSDLLLHWDFEGTDLETQLANKAAAGSATDSISFNTDGTSSKIENGECTVGDETTEWLSFIVDTDNGKGNTLVDKVTDGYTIYVRFKMDKKPTETATVMVLNHKNGKAIKQRLWMGATGSLSLRPNNAGANQFSVSNPIVTPEEYCAVAVTLKKNEDKTFTVSLYQTYDDWENTMSASKENLTGAESTPVMANGFDMLFAGGMWNQITGGNQADSFKPGSSYTYDDIRFYGKALSEDEIKTVQTVEDTVDADAIGFSTDFVGQLRLIEPWGLKVSTVALMDGEPFTQAQYSAVKGAGFYFYSGDTDNIATVKTGEYVKVSEYTTIDGKLYMSGAMSGIYTQNLDKTVTVVAVITLKNGETVTSQIKKIVPLDFITSLKDNENVSAAERAVYKAMYDMHVSYKAYLAELGA